MKRLAHVGTIERVSLPSEAIQDVPAKIDTGADSSAIWASNIVEQGKELSFTLFGPNSPFFTGKRLATRRYKVVSVKNSFGHSELRYKVSLQLTIAGRTVTANVTLANRENNRYPILIGRRTLRGKFLVDVSARSEPAELHVLMLSAQPSKTTAQFAKNLEAAGKKLRITYATYHDLQFTTGEPANKITVLPKGRDAASFDLVFFKSTARRHMDIAASLARYLDCRNVPFIDEAIKHYPAPSKLYQYIIMTDKGVAVPSSVYLHPVVLVKSYDMLVEQLGLPFVLKDIHGNKGEHNYLVRTKTDFSKACKEAAKDDARCVAQAFVPNDCDYRVLVFGNKIALVIRRSRTSDKTHLNNTSQGASAEIVPASDLPPAVQKTSLVAAKMFDRQVAGVDIVEDKETGLWYCLEVNDGPQLASGSFTAEKEAVFADYLERKLTS